MIPTKHRIGWIKHVSICTNLSSTCSAALTATMFWKTLRFYRGTWAATALLTKHSLEFHGNPKFLDCSLTLSCSWAISSKTWWCIHLCVNELVIFGKCIFTTSWLSHWLEAWLCRTLFVLGLLLAGSTVCLTFGRHQVGSCLKLFLRKPQLHLSFCAHFFGSSSGTFVSP
jgi:hypothetical protein